MLIMTTKKIEFENIGKVSEHNLRVHKAGFKLLVNQNRIEQAKYEYQCIFTPEEMDYLIEVS